MKKSILSFILILSVAIVFAQDVIYTISGEISQSKTALDSILVENISTGKRALFAKLPALQTYQINLTKNAFWGTVGIDDKKVKSFSESRNLPGLIAVSFWGNAPVETDISVFAANGQMVFATKGKTILPGNTVEIKLVNEGVFFVRFDTPAETKTFKAVGVNQADDFDVSVTPSNMNRVQEKSGILSDASLANFLPGDTIRVSIYKNGYYARPKGMKITTSSAVNFPFEVSTVAATGTSDGYVPLNEITTNVTTFDTLTGVVKINYTGENPELLPGDIITVDLDTMGYLRKVTQTLVNGNVISVQTEPATMNEIFVDKEIKLNTGLMNPGVQLKSNASMEEISEALTDEHGYIHPVAVYYHTDDGKVITKSAFTTPQNGEETVPLYDFTRDLKDDLYGKSGDNVHLYISEGSASLTANAVFEMDFDYKGELDADTKVRQGDLKYFTFYLEGNAGFDAKLALDLTKAYEKEDKKKLRTIGKVTAKFVVGVVPVWITFKADIFGNYKVAADASAHADFGFASNHTIKIGGTYTKATDSFAPIKSFTPVNQVYPLNLTGEVKASARLEIYPRAEVKFYGFFGPYIEVVPYVEGQYNGRVHSVVTTGGTENFLAWNSGIDLGLDFRVGSKLTFLWGLFDKEFGPTVINGNVWQLWQSPTNIALLTTLPTETAGGTVIPLKFKITDLLEKPVILCPIYIKGNGTFSKQIVFTNINGEATIDWTVGASAGDNSFTATLYKADKSVIKELTKTVKVGGGTTGTGQFVYDGRTYKTVIINGREWMAENLTYLPGVYPPTSGSNTEPRYYVYGYTGSDVAAAKQQPNYTTYGVLYNWPAAKAACPPGWHLPSDAEWTALENYLIVNGYNYDGTTSENKIAKSLATATGWNFNTNEGAVGNSDFPEKQNSTGFSGIPGGYRFYDGNFYWFWCGFYWSSSESGSTSASSRHLCPDTFYFGHGNDYKEYGFSVRCVRD